MKKLLFTLILMGLIYTVQAQAIKMDGGFGFAMTFGDLKSYGIDIALEPKFFFNEKIAAGIRTEAAALFGGTLDVSGAQVDVSASSRVAILGKGEYYFSENSTRFFVGLMAGWYRQANSGVSVNGNDIPDSSLSAVNSFGFAPQVGVTFNNFRISGMYHVITGEDTISASTGSGAEVNRSYLVIELGFKIFRAGL